MAKSIEEIKKEIEELLQYRKENYTDSSDEQNFVIPFIAMNDGHTPAQIRAQSKGIYKDIQRSPFVRKTGVFTENGTIQDIDISSLVYYGTLQQSKIAPTLENVDVKLYFREPSLTKVPDTTNSADPNTYADKYIWREVQPGFHVYNNDTVYGYEWLILQSDYVSTDGIYNLHMNIEDGLGVCKFAGTQAPISLKGVQYKIVITAKNLWNREFSLLDSMPLIKSLDTRTDDLAPSVNAVREYYEKALETLKVVTQTLLVKNSEAEVLMQDKDGGIYIKNLTLGEIENTEEFVKGLGEDLEEHISQTVDNALLDDDGNVIGVHGLVNKGAKGNLNAKSLAGATLSNGAQSVQEDVDPLSYIPFVDKFDTIGYGTTVKQYKRSSGQDPVPYYQTVLAANDTQQTLYLTRTSLRDELKSLVESVIVGATTINYRFATIDKVPTLKITSGKAENGDVTLQVATVSTDEIDFGGGFTITANRVAYWNGQSSIAYKNPHSELLNSKLKTAKKGAYAILTPNIDKDANGNPVSNLDTTTINSGKDELIVPDCSVAVTAWTKLGSALQALYELPLGTYQYKRGGKEYKEQLGIFIERVNQVRDHLAELRGSGEDAVGVPNPDVAIAHKRNTLIKAKSENVLNRTEGLGDLAKVGDEYLSRMENNAYTYTDEEVKSIVNYLNLLTSKDELSQEIRNTVGVLLMAAKETQERLLDIETAVYGWDAKTVPGSDAAKKEFINGQIAEALQDQLNNSPFLLGLNRLMRAILLEIYDTTDLEKIDAEIESRVTDSDTLGEKATVKSRMDQVDEIASVLYSQVSAMIKFYSENIASDESSHTYREMTSFDKATKRISKEGLTEDTSLQDAEKVKDDHSGTVDIDVDRTWKNLPAKDDVKSEIKESVGFGKVADSAHKHTPNLDETGLVRVPVKAQDTDNVSEGDVDHTDVSEYVKSDENESGETRRFWDLYKLDKSKTNYKDDYAAAGSYNPFFKTKLVAWEQAKVERMNTKLSELTKTIYGTDDVSMKYPNRTEVLRRNITNLIDDLYPNRSFKIENPITVINDSDATFFEPFKTSKEQNPKEKAVASTTTDEVSARAHTSLLTWFDNEIFNFKVTNHFVGKVLDSSKGYNSNKQIELLDEGINFSTKSLITDTTPFSTDYGTYGKAYSRLDMLENLIGVEDCYITNLYADDITDTNSLIKSQIDKWAIGFASSDRSFELSKNLTKENENIENLNTQIENLNTRLSEISNEKSALSSKKANVENTKEQLANTVYDKDTLKQQELAAKEAYEQEEAKLEPTTGSRDAAKVALEEKQNALTKKEEELSVDNERLSEVVEILGSIDAVIAKSSTAASNREALETILEKYKPLEEAKTVQVNEWIQKLFDNPNASLQSIKDSAEALTRNLKELNVSGSAFNESTNYEADQFNLQIDKVFKKDATVYQYITSQGGRKLEDPLKFPAYTLPWITTYYKRSDSDVLYLDQALTQALEPDAVLIFHQGTRDEASKLEIEPQITHTEVIEKEADSAETTETTENTETPENTVVDAPTNPTEEKESETIVVVDKDAVYRYAYNNAIILRYAKTKHSASENLEIINAENIVVYNGKIYNLIDLGNSNYELQQNTDLIEIDYSTATEYNFPDNAEIVSDTGAIVDKNTIIALSSCAAAIDLVLAPVACNLDYEYTYTVTWTGSGLAPRCRAVIDSRNQTGESEEGDDGKVDQANTEVDESGVVTKTDRPYARVYKFKGTCLIDLQTLTDDSEITFTGSDEFTCSNDSAWTPIETAVAETTKDLEAAKTIFEEAIADIGSVNYLEEQKADLLKEKSELTVKIEQGTKEEIAAVNAATTDLNNAQAALDSLEASIEAKYTAWQEAIARTNNIDQAIAEKDKKLGDYQAQIDSIAEQILALQESYESVEANIATCRDDLQQAETRKASIQEELNSLLGENAEKPALPYYSTELNFNGDYVINPDSLDYQLAVSRDLRTSSNVNYVITRKEKSLQSRLTTVEAFLDSIAKGLNYANNLAFDQATYNQLNDTKGTLTKNIRFESVESWKALKRAFDMTECKQVDPRIFDLDLSESWANASFDFSEHNSKVWQLVAYSRKAKKGYFALGTPNDTAYSTISGNVVGSYEITNAQLIVDPSNLPYQDEAYLNGVSKYSVNTIKVVYLLPGFPITQSIYEKLIANRKTIYLLGKTAKRALSSFYTNNQDSNISASTLLDSAKGWQNQTEYNIYKTISNLFYSLLNAGKNPSIDGIVAAQDANNLYYKMMLLAHPVGSIYLSLNSRDPGSIFGGSWTRLPSGLLASSTGGRSTLTDTSETPEYQSLVGTYTSGNVSVVSVGNGDGKITLNAVPPHSHDIYDPGHYHNALMNHGADDNNHTGFAFQTGDTTGDVYWTTKPPRWGYTYVDEPSDTPGGVHTNAVNGDHPSRVSPIQTAKTGVTISKTGEGIESSASTTAKYFKPRYCGLFAWVRIA